MRIHEILYGSGSGGSIPLTYAPDSDPEPAIFVSDLQYVNKKLFLVERFFLLITVLFEGTFT